MAILVSIHSEPTTDEVLLRRYQSGEIDAFNRLVQRHVQAVYAFICRQTSKTVAEDLCQEVFLRVVQRAKTFRFESKFTTWLFAIARNLCIDHLRKMSLRKHPSLDDPISSSEPSPLSERIADPHPSASAERAARSLQIRRRIDAAVAKLPEEQREVFLLRQVARLPFQEIAVATDTPENTVKSRMRYALERLRNQLHELEDDARHVAELAHAWAEEAAIR